MAGCTEEVELADSAMASLVQRMKRGSIDISANIIMWCLNEDLLITKNLQACSIKTERGLVVRTRSPSPCNETLVSFTKRRIWKKEIKTELGELKIEFWLPS